MREKTIEKAGIYYRETMEDFSIWLIVGTNFFENDQEEVRIGIVFAEDIDQAAEKAEGLVDRVDYVNSIFNLLSKLEVLI